MTTLRWLHFTDLHVDRLDDARRQHAADLFLDDLKRVTRRLGPWDVVLFTGDLAFSGQERQYRILDEELERIWGVFREVHPTASRLPYLLAVPGNHDLERPAKGNAIARGLLRDSDAREALWRGEADNIEPVRRWFGAYSDWWKRCKLRPPSGIVEGLLPGDFAYVLEKDGARFGFVGMNSAFLDISDDVGEGDLWMDARQIQPACDNNLLRWLDHCTLAFLLTHHPPSWFAARSRDLDNPVFLAEKYFAAHFCGHLHEALFETRRLGGGDARRIWQAASLFGVQKLAGGELDRKYGYTAGCLELGAEGAGVTTWPRLAARLQGGSYRFTADFTFALEDDLAHTLSEALSVRSFAMASSAPASPAALTPPSPVTWADAVERSPLWQACARRDAARVAALKRLAVEVAHAAWCAWEEAERALPGDPWRDDRYPLRVLDRVAGLVAPGSAGPEETWMLVVAPFVREGIFAAGAVWMAAAEPLDLEGRGGAAEPRNTLEQVHRSRADLVRHAGRITGEARDAVCFWMMQQALERSPHLWSRRPTVKPVQELFRTIQRSRDAAGIGAWLDLERLIRLARAVGVNPDALDAEGGIGRDAEEITLAGVHLRAPALAYLLCVAGWQALDLREADEVAVDHVGRDLGTAPAVLRDALREASWSAGEDRHLLAHGCSHPVVDFVLRDLVERADAALERTRAKLDATPHGPFALLTQIPERFSADHVRPARAGDGRPYYTLPHVRFRLDHQRIRELLMGAQLYGDPSLAIREMYQNALDACRYRRARGEYLERTGSPAYQPYEGRIAFKQAFDERGRPYIECTDNGVGMTKNVVERVFAVAGRRFHDMPDFVEERAAWQRCKPPIELFPNSQFGIGVLSYFMLADEVTVWTRRYEADGSLGEPLVVHIASASGLFRLEEGRECEMPGAGTRVRLLLASTTYVDKYEMEEPISCLSTLGALLLVAEFATTAEESGTLLAWKPGELTRHQRYHSNRRPVRATRDPNIWWYPYGDGMLLCDGIVTESRYKCAVVNLHGRRYPKMSVDRKDVNEWDDSWIRPAMADSWRELIDWNELSFDCLWSLEVASARSARLLADVLKSKDAHLWFHGASFNPRDSTGPVRLPIQALGCSVIDEYIVGSRSIMRDPLADVSAIGLHISVAWRLMLWTRCVACLPQVNWPQSAILDSVCSLIVAPGDALLLFKRSYDRMGAYGLIGLDDQYYYSNFFEGEVPPLQVLRASVCLDLKPSAIIRRIEELAPLGLRPPSVDTNMLDEIDVNEDDLLLLSQDLDGWYPWIKGRVSPAHILAVSRRSGISPRELIERLRCFVSIGVVSPSIDPSALDQITVTDEDLCLLSRDLDGRAPWLEGELSPLHIVRAARALGISTDVVLARLVRFVPLGIVPPSVNADALDAITLSDEDERLLRSYINSEPWIDEVSACRRLFILSKELEIDPKKFVRRLESFAGLGLRLPKLDEREFDSLEITEDEWRMLSYDIDGKAPWLMSGASLRRIARCGRKLRCSFSYIISMAVRLGIASSALCACAESLGDAPPDMDDERLCSAFDHVEAPDAAIAFQLGKERARYRLWYLADEQFDARVERLRPLLEIAIAESFR
ncbi:metallophosphoesterase [Sorangium sp. So ce185]|uniref:wHTH domain-containing protein n=1 Tax=Sorangium sp. So ce185 TaxID=3133287 RepID=UPI003F5E9D5B